MPLESRVLRTEGKRNDSIQYRQYEANAVVVARLMSVLVASLPIARLIWRSTIRRFSRSVLLSGSASTCGTAAASGPGSIRAAIAPAR